METALRRLLCPECRTALKVPRSVRRTRVMCPTCKKTFQACGVPPDLLPNDSHASVSTDRSDTQVQEVPAKRTAATNARSNHSTGILQLTIIFGAVGVCTCLSIGAFLHLSSSPNLERPTKDVSLGQRYYSYEREWRIAHDQPEFADEERLAKIRDAVDATDAKALADFIGNGTLAEWSAADKNMKVAAAFVISKNLRDHKRGDILYEKIINSLESALAWAPEGSAVSVSEAVAMYVAMKTKVDAIDASKTTFSGFESESRSDGDVLLGQFREAMSPWYKIYHKLRPNDWNYGLAIDRRERQAGYAIHCRDNIVTYLILSLNQDHRHGDNTAILQRAVLTLSPSFTSWLGEAIQSNYKGNVQTFESENRRVALYWNENIGGGPPGIELEFSLDGRPFRYVPKD